MDEIRENQFINHVSAALKDCEGHRQAEADRFEIGFTESESPLEKMDTPPAKGEATLLKRLIKSAEPLNLKVIPLKDTVSVARAIVRLVLEKTPEWGDEKSLSAWSHPLIKRLNLSERLKQNDIPVYDTTPPSDPKEKIRLRKRVAASFIGVTSADYCVADTATLVMKSRPGHARMVSLLPTIHIAVIKQEQIIKDFKALYAVLKSDLGKNREGLTNCMTFVTGPSKTADIEATMIDGAHGPREVYLYIITGAKTI